MSGKTNVKSDVRAKAAFIGKLTNDGYENARVVAAPADIVAEKDGATWYFEIKKTSRTDKYFGAATVTEWAQAVTDPEHFRFVVAVSTDGDETFSFKEYTPAEFMEFSTVPPFKVFFNIDLSGRQAKKLKRTKNRAVCLTEGLVNELKRIYDGFRNDQND